MRRSGAVSAGALWCVLSERPCEVGCSRKVTLIHSSLQVLLHIIPPPPCHWAALDNLFSQLGGIVHGMLARLKRAGLIEVVGHLEGERTLAYQRRDHLVWQAASQLTSEVTDTLGIGGPYDS